MSIAIEGLSGNLDQGLESHQTRTMGFRLERLLQWLFKTILVGFFSVERIGVRRTRGYGRVASKAFSHLRQLQLNTGSQLRLGNLRTALHNWLQDYKQQLPQNEVAFLARHFKNCQQPFIIYGFM
jgi:hypothetical protein